MRACGYVFLAAIAVVCEAPSVDAGRALVRVEVVLLAKLGREDREVAQVDQGAELLGLGVVLGEDRSMPMRAFVLIVNSSFVGY